jgi:hypothetical protein
MKGRFIIFLIACSMELSYRWNLVKGFFGFTVKDDAAELPS